MKRLTEKECLDRATLYEEAMEHIEMAWSDCGSTRPAADFVIAHLARELDQWEVQAKIQRETYERDKK